MNNLQHDVIVVGAGPAGSSAAYSIAKHGLTVALLEKENFVAETIRTSGVTWINDIQKFDIPDTLYNKIKNYSFYSPNNVVTIHGSTAKAAVLDVRKTYQYLANRAINHGAELFVNTEINSASIDKNKKVMCANHTSTFNGKIIIDSSGFNSVIGKLLNLVKPWKTFGVGAEYEAYAENIDPETLSLMVGKKYSPSGYAWIFPVNKKIIRIGVGINKPQSNINPLSLLKKILHEKTGPIQNLDNITPIEFHYGLIPNEGPIRRTVYDNLVLVGDAAGYANPIVLEGIRYAIKFGMLAGNIVSNAIQSNDLSQNALSLYEKNWKKSINSKIKSAYKIQNRWLQLTDDEWDMELNLIKELTSDELINFIKSDFNLLNMIKFVKNHPKLAIRNFFATLSFSSKK